MSSPNEKNKKFNFKELIRDGIKTARPYTYKIKGEEEVETKEEPNRKDN